MAGRPPPARRVLMFHGVLAAHEQPPQGREDGAGLYDVAAARFAEQLALLRDHAVVKSPGRAGENHGENQVELTFDDGEANNFHNVFPALQEVGFQASFFVTPARVGSSGYMSWPQLMQLADAGMIVGAHGRTHRMLVGLDDDALVAETAGAREDLEQGLSRPVTAFSVPRGFYDARVLQALKDAGYQSIYVTDINPAVANGEIARVAVKGSWDLARFSRAVSGRTSVRDRVWGAALAGAKRGLGPRRYDRLRSRLIALRGRNP